ncbi:hypothetical protein [Natronosalvus vescus]|uniref:hypothetical protein n=1 Tax=Natronosalvus vescus TaxID=2953881 RepID=UPI002090FEDE|nr:hypothetical protein [Natronosalvus vescus]
MNKELFGVFGGRETFERFRSVSEFDAVLTGSSITVGIRDPGLGTPGWSARYESDAGTCVVWGEAYAPSGGTNTARWLLERVETDGPDAFESFNGSYLAVVDPADGDAFVATDPVRSRECFYTNEPGVRLFGTDAATVAATLGEPTPRREGVLEFLHLGLILGTKTAVEGMHRLPLDSRLTATDVDSFDRFVYSPREFNYVEELASRLERALDRRSILPGRKGLLLSAGYDSRIFLSAIPDLEVSYTVGSLDAQEVAGAKRVSTQYGVDHVAFQPDDRYLYADRSKVQYSQGMKESLHIHHAGYTDEMAVDTIYHGLLSDTFYRGHFTAQDGVDVLGKRVPFERLDPDPNPVDVLLQKYGYDRDASRELTDRLAIDVDPEAFVREAVGNEVESVSHRAATTQNNLTCCGIANQPSVPFHNHLADNFFASFLATDIELLEWHLQTPPAHRTTETFLRACERIDPELLRHHPPDRPHRTTLLNEVEGFVRRKTPFITSFEPPWPDRRHLFEQYNLDQRLLPDLEHVHTLPARHKLRINDIGTWLEHWSTDPAASLPWLQPAERTAVSATR